MSVLASGKSADWQTTGQADLFAASGPAVTDPKILDAIDKLTDKYGKAVLKLGLGRQ